MGDRPLLVLVHSPSVGPATWSGVADRLAARGWPVVVPSLLHVGNDPVPPFWPRVVSAVRDAVGDGPRPLILAAHSNAGLFVPLLVEALPQRVDACLFVDAALPPGEGTAPMASPVLLDLLRDKAHAGRLPPWTQWWDEEDVAALFPDASSRATICAEQPRLPLAYYEQTVPAPTGWDDRPCGYLAFGPTYAAEQGSARERGWLVESLPGNHLHLVVDPDTVTGVLLTMLQELGVAGGEPPVPHATRPAAGKGVTGRG
jgi:pimeloyl-ACP methyl ester carboxylesterase